MTICWNIPFFFEPVFVVSLFIYLHFYLLVLQANYIKTTGEHLRKGVTPVKLVSIVLKITLLWIFLSVLLSGFKNQCSENHF